MKVFNEVSDLNHRLRTNDVLEQTAPDQVVQLYSVINIVVKDLFVRKITIFTLNVRSLLLTLNNQRISNRLDYEARNCYE